MERRRSKTGNNLEVFPADAKRRRGGLDKVDYTRRACLCGAMIASFRWKVHQKKCESARLLD
jgi:hypothetical protein